MFKKNSTYQHYDKYIKTKIEETQIEFKELRDDITSKGYQIKKNEKEEEVVLDKDPIRRGIQLVESMPDEAKTNIKGKLYAQVARRNEYFWKAVGIEGRIENEF